MKTAAEKGFFVAKNGSGPVYIVLHSGPNFGDLGEARDTNADEVASLCWEKTGGSLLLSSMPRSRLVGIDMNRGVPGIEEALKKPVNSEYMNRCGWWALDRNDYEKRLSIYRNFWSTAKSLGRKFLLLHTLSCRLANFPSILDIITLDSRGYDREKARKIAKKLNKKYSGFFKEISTAFKEQIIFENKIRIKSTLSRENWLQEEFFKKETDVIKRFSEKSIYNKMKKNLTAETFLRAAGSALERGGHPGITVEEKFSGKKAIGPKENLLGKGLVLELEINHFLSFYYPQRARDIILDILRML